MAPIFGYNKFLNVLVVNPRIVYHKPGLEKEMSATY